MQAQLGFADRSRRIERLRARLLWIAAAFAIAFIAACREQATRPLVQQVDTKSHLLAPCTYGELDWYFTYPDQNCPQSDTVVDHKVHTLCYPAVLTRGDTVDCRIWLDDTLQQLTIVNGYSANASYPIRTSVSGFWGSTVTSTLVLARYRSRLNDHRSEREVSRQFGYAAVAGRDAELHCDSKNIFTVQCGDAATADAGPVRGWDRRSADPRC